MASSKTMSRPGQQRTVGTAEAGADVDTIIRDETKPAPRRTMAGSISSRIDDRTAATVAPDEPGAVSDRAAPTEDAIEPSGIATSDVTTSGVETSGPAILIEIDPGVSGGFVQ